MHLLAKPQRILITGASQGIGRATALALAPQGHSLVLVARREAALEQVAEEVRRLGGRAQVLCLDVTQAEPVRAGIEQLLIEGPIDVLVNNAGACSQLEFLRQSAEQQHAEMELNYFGVQHMTRALLPSFIARRGGSIVNVSSLLGSAAAPTTANYSASKAALEAFSQGLRGEVARFGVRVTVFVAPHTQTELGCQTDFRGVRSLPVTYVANQLLRAIDRMPARAGAGPVYAVLLRLCAWFPRWMERQMLQSVEHLLSRQ